MRIELSVSMRPAYMRRNRFSQYSAGREERMILFSCTTVVRLGLGISRSRSETEFVKRIVRWKGVSMRRGRLADAMSVGVN